MLQEAVAEDGERLLNFFTRWWSTGLNWDVLKVEQLHCDQPAHIKAKNHQDHCPSAEKVLLTASWRPVKVFMRAAAAGVFLFIQVCVCGRSA